MLEMSVLHSFLGKFVLKYLRFFAKIRIGLEKPVIIGIGGSSGKSSLVSILSSILSEKFSVRQSGGKNSESGIPLSVLGMQLSGYSYFFWLSVLIKIPFYTFFGKKSDIFIAEMGIDSPLPPKNMDYLLSIIRPNIAVLTSITYEHAVYFEKSVSQESDKEDEILKLIAKEELKLISSLKESDTAILNIDNKLVSSALPLKSKTIEVSKSSNKVDFYIEKIENSIEKFSLILKVNGRKYDLEIDQPLPSHYAYTFAEAIAVADSLGVIVTDAIRSIESNFTLPPGRASVFPGIKNSVIIDSTYNSVAAEPLMDFLDLLSEVSSGRRRVAILGEMREQGEIARTEHERVANKILETTDFVIIIGKCMLEFVAPILKQKNFPFLAFETFSEAKKSILNEVKEKDLVLIKGSQNQLFLERAVEILLKDPQDKEKLCRRGVYWDRVRSKVD